MLGVVLESVHCAGGLIIFYFIFGNVLGIDVGNNLYPLLVVNRYTFYLLYLSAALISVRYTIK